MTLKEIKSLKILGIIPSRLKSTRLPNKPLIKINGEAMISEKHCNFIVNLKNAKAHQIEELGENVKQKVFENSGIHLNWEIERVGNR